MEPIKSVAELYLKKKIKEDGKGWEVLQWHWMLHNCLEKGLDNVWIMGEHQEEWIMGSERNSHEHDHMFDWFLKGYLIINSINLHFPMHFSLDDKLGGHWPQRDFCTILFHEHFNMSTGSLTLKMLRFLGLHF